MENIKYTMIMEINDKKYAGQGRGLHDAMACLIHAVIDENIDDHGVELSRQVMRLTKISVIVSDLMERDYGI